MGTFGALACLSRAVGELSSPRWKHWPAAMPRDREQAQRLKAILGWPVPRHYTTALRDLPKSFAAPRDERGAADELARFLDRDVVAQQNELAREEDSWTEEGPWPPAPVGTSEQPMRYDPG